MHEHERPATTLVDKALVLGSAVALQVINDGIALVMVMRRQTIENSIQIWSEDQLSPHSSLYLAEAPLQISILSAAYQK